jgi:acyl-CoA thioester hydrolase
MKRFIRTFTALPAHIDELGHVNNAVWVTWIQDVATSHWAAVAAPDHVEKYIWVVTRHEIDYRGNISEGESVTGETFIPEGPRGAQFDRCVEFRNAAGKRIVAARSTWAMLDKATGRLVRIPAEVAAPFLP